MLILVAPLCPMYPTHRASEWGALIVMGVLLICKEVIWDSLTGVPSGASANIVVSCRSGAHKSIPPFATHMHAQLQNLHVGYAWSFEALHTV